MWYQEQFVTDDGIYSIRDFEVISWNPQPFNSKQQREMADSMLTRDYNCISMCQSMRTTTKLLLRIQNIFPKMKWIFWFSDLPPKQQSITAPPSRNSSKTPTSPAPSALNKKEYVRHKVDYLGALPISASRSTNLAALQRPLKDLYFKWRALRNLGHSNLPGTLEINDNGLTVQYIRELHKGVQVRNRTHH